MSAHALWGHVPLLRTACRLLMLVSLIVCACQVIRATETFADTAPPVPSTPATVSADALPTVQINGVVWSQVTVGSTVFATGSFSAARPAGAAPGTDETSRANLLAYDITTGELITGFAHRLNAQGLVVTASPDHSTVYVGGDFTRVDGQPHQRIAAFKATTGALIKKFAPAVDDEITTIAATDTTVYFGGRFTEVNGSTRHRLAAVAAGSGALLSWAPSADQGAVRAMVLTPNGSKLIVGGQFQTINGAAAYGLAALDPISGRVRPWAATSVIHNGGHNAGINSLTTDGTRIYGTGFVYGAGGNLEGAFAASAELGTIKWIEDCHGDTYGAFPIGQVVYVVSHEHDCGNIGSFPQTSPVRSYYRATAFTTMATHTIAHNTSSRYFDWYGNSAPDQLDWYPTLFPGSYTGLEQAAWSVTGNRSYVALGGEFPKVNGSAQQGLVRFAVSSRAPNRAGPRPSDALTPALSSTNPGTVRLTFGTTWDQDNAELTYRVVRDGHVSSPVYTTSATSRFWQLPQISWLDDTGLVPGAVYSYRVDVSDPFGNVMVGHSSTVRVAASPPSAYVQDVLNDGARNYWRLGDMSGGRFADFAGGEPLTPTAGVSAGAQAGIADADPAASFDGVSGMASSSISDPAPTTFTIESWFTTSTPHGGLIVGFGNAQGESSSKYDRHLYLDDAGHVVFGVRSGGVKTVSSPNTYNDGLWHYAVGTLSPAGMTLYVDGQSAAGDPNTTSATSYPGYWRIAAGNLDGWPAKPANKYFQGTLDEVAVYPVALTAQQVMQHFTDGAVDITPAAEFTESCSDLTCCP